jgi:hypothetical protein
MNRSTQIASLLLFVGIVACRPPPRTISDSPSDSGAESIASPNEYELRWLRDTARAAESAGASKVRLAAFGSGTPGDSVEGFAGVGPEHCILAFARGSSSIEDLDLHAYGDDGTQFGSDDSPDDLPTLLLCAEKPTRLFLAARVAQGSGVVALGVQTVPKVAADAVAKAVGARNYGAATAQQKEAWPGLEAALKQHREDMGGDWLDQRRVALPLDARVPTHLNAIVPANSCLDLLVLPSDDLAQVQMSVADERGRVFARARRSGRNRALVLCAKEVERHVTLELRPYAGRGLAVAAVSVTSGDKAWPVGDEIVHMESGATRPLEGTLPKPSATADLKLLVGSIESWETEVRGCVRIDLGPNVPVAGATVRVWNSAGDLVGESNSFSGAPLFVCEGGPIRVDAEANERSGQLELRVIQERESSSPSLTRAPLAASRLLGEAARGGQLTMPHEIGKVTEVALASDQVKRAPLSIPASHCQTIVASKGPGGWGVEARIVDQNGEILDLARASDAVTARACAPQGAHLNATLELRAVRGRAQGLWSARQEKWSKQE